MPDNKPISAGELYSQLAHVNDTATIVVSVPGYRDVEVNGIADIGTGRIRLTTYAPVGAKTKWQGYFGPLADRIGVTCACGACIDCFCRLYPHIKITVEQAADGALTFTLDNGNEIRHITILQDQLAAEASRLESIAAELSQ